MARQRMRRRGRVGLVVEDAAGTGAAYTGAVWGEAGRRPGGPGEDQQGFERLKPLATTGRPRGEKRGGGAVIKNRLSFRRPFVSEGPAIAAV